MSKINCNNCRNVVESSSNFCPVCGEKLRKSRLNINKDTLDSINKENEQFAKNYQQHPDKVETTIPIYSNKNRKGTKFAFIFIGVALLIFLSPVVFKGCSNVLNETREKQQYKEDESIYKTAVEQFNEQLYSEALENFKKVSTHSESEVYIAAINASQQQAHTIIQCNDILRVLNSIKTYDPNLSAFINENITRIQKFKRSYVLYEIKNTYDYDKIISLCFEIDSFSKEALDKQAVHSDSEIEAIYNYASANKSLMEGYSESMVIYYITLISPTYSGVFDTQIRNFASSFISVDEWQKQYEMHEKTKKEASIQNSKKNPVIGMTKEQVRDSRWGEPQDINKTTTAYGTSEQWVYSDYRYVYFDDGIVTAIHE